MCIRDSPTGGRRSFSYPDSSLLVDVLTPKVDLCYVFGEGVSTGTAAQPILTTRYVSPPEVVRSQASRTSLAASKLCASESLDNGSNVGNLPA